MTSWWTELRSRIAATDPGRERLHLASVATASMVLAAVLATGLRELTGQPVTVVMFAVVLAMLSNLAVNEPDLGRRRVTTVLMLGPAAAAASLSALLSGNRILADVVFVLIMIVAVAVRRYGPRATALGMAGFMPYFFVLFLQAGPAELPYLLSSAVIGVGSAFLLRCVVFTRRNRTVLDALVRAFEARLHALALAVLDVVESDDSAPDLEPVLRAQSRLNATALLVADRLDEAEEAPEPRRPAYPPGRSGPGGPEDAGTGITGLRQWIIDSELAGERLAMTVRRAVERRDPIPAADRAALAEGVRAVAAGTAAGTPRPMVAALLDTARDSVEPLVARPAAAGPAAREQRMAFAVRRLADALQATVEQARERVADRDREQEGPPDPESGTATVEPEAPQRDRGPQLHTRQAVQVGVATSLAIVVGELISPARWYWAVIAAFIVFAGTASRGDVLSRGWARAVGTAGGVLAGMVLAFLVAGNVVLTLVLLFACAFLALYLVQVSQAMMAFWITAVLALLYGLIGQFSVETLLLRVEETIVGGALGMLAAFLILPTRSRTAFADALDDALQAVVGALRDSVDRLLGRGAGADPMAAARAADTAVATVRARAVPLEHPIARRPLRRGVHHTVRVLGALDYYTRLLAAQAAGSRAPAWAETLDPATERVVANLDGLRRILDDGWGPSDGRDHPPGTDPADYGVRSAEDLLDAAESAASAAPEGTRGDRVALLSVARVLRRVDQLAVGLARELCGGRWNEPTAGERTGPAASGSRADTG